MRRHGAEIGETMFVTGITQMLSAHMIGRVMMFVDARILLAIGFFNFALSCCWMTDVTKGLGFLADVRAADFARLVAHAVHGADQFRGDGLRLAPHEMKNASGLFNHTRNLGGIVGPAIITPSSTTAGICTGPRAARAG